MLRVVIFVMWFTTLFIHEAISATLTLKYMSGDIETPANVNLRNTVTMGNNADCTMIGSSQNVTMSSVTVSNSGANFNASLTVEGGGTVNPNVVCNGQYTDYIIFKTNVEGVGISYNAASGVSSGKPIPQETNKIVNRTGGPGSGSGAMTVAVIVRLWKIPSASEIPYGNLSIQGPRIAQIGTPVNSDDSIVCIGFWSVGGGCRVNRIDPINIAAFVYSSTCEFVNASKTVQMGSRNIPANAAQGYGSQWVDASFQLRCPNAYGYNGDPTNTSTITRNNTVAVTVQPYNGFEDATNGIIKLDGTGAQGVGIQLAWGDYGNQGNLPANPVKLNTPTSASTLSGNFAAGPYAIGSNPVSGDGAIKMAARYVRTSGSLQPGQANAKVEILANYQ